MPPEADLPDPWFCAPSQSTTSAATSVRIIPRALRLIPFVAGTVNADIGGGRFNDGTAFLAALGVANLVFDPFNRSRADNEAAAARLRGGGAHSATVLNVLNVIACPVIRDRVIALAADAVGSDGVAWFQVYEGNRSGVPRATPKGWQENRPLAAFLPEIAVHFAEVQRRGGLIRAARPHVAPWRAAGRAVRTLEQALRLAPHAVDGSSGWCSEATSQAERAA